MQHHVDWDGMKMGKNVGDSISATYRSSCEIEVSMSDNKMLLKTCLLQRFWTKMMTLVVLVAACELANFYHYIFI